MKNKLTPLSKLMLPEHLSSNDSNFGLFVETYYEWLEKRTNPNGLINYHGSNNDIDKTMDEFIDDFYKTYAEYIPKDSANNRRDLLKRVGELHKAKGTTKAIKLLFKLVYNEDIEISYPKENILKSSDGRWVQDQAIRLKISSGNIDTTLLGRVYTLTWMNLSGVQTVQVKNIVDIGFGVYDIYFKKQKEIVIYTGDSFELYDEFNKVVAAGSIFKIPSKVVITRPGKNFKPGKVIRIPGTVKDTLARVKKVDDLGGIISVDIIDTGSIYETDYSVSISPFNFTYTPQNTLSIDNDQISIGRNDRMDGFYETFSIVKVNNGIGDPESYFAENYIATNEDYSGIELVNQITDNRLAPQDDTQITNPGITEEEFNESIAFVKLVLEPLVTFVGKFESDYGQLSNPFVRLQDSYYYQDYSYVIQSSITIKKYKEFYTKMMHPAGTKLFSNLLLSSIASGKNKIGIALDKQISLLFDESLAITDSVSKFVSKPRTDSVALTDQANKSTTLAKSDSVTPSDTTTKSLGKGVSESLTLTDTTTKSISITEPDSLVVTDEVPGQTNTYAEPGYFAEIYNAEPAADDVVVVKTP